MRLSTSKQANKQTEHPPTPSPHTSPTKQRNEMDGVEIKEWQLLVMTGLGNAVWVSGWGTGAVIKERKVQD